MVKGLLVAMLVVLFLPLQAKKDSARVEHDYEIKLEAEYRYFFKDPQFAGQERHFPSFAITPSYSLEWNDGYDALNFTGFFRLDVDPNRTHWDIRELYYQKAKKNWELSVGLKKVFWGVTESVHLVDIINQTDQVESFDGEQKLGQPMLQFKWNNFKVGTFELYYLPYHRQRQFSGEKGRLRFAQVIEREDIGYEGDLEEWRQDLAFRWKHYFGIFDIGVSHFYGTGREPLFVIDSSGINAFYPVINQSGLDLQITHHSFLWKLEAIYRYAEAQDFFAFAAGLEYTLANINRKGLDIGLIGEYLHDTRDELSLSGLQNDLFLGTRIAFNDEDDTAILFGTIIDLNGNGVIYGLEASRRLVGSLKAEVEARIFTNIDDDELILSNFRDDSFMRLMLAYYF